jgi:hypothetical protein
VARARPAGRAETRPSDAASGSDQQTTHRESRICQCGRSPQGPHTRFASLLDGSVDHAAHGARCLLRERGLLNSICPPA